MKRRNTIQKDLVLKAVFELKRHVTAEDVYEFIKKEHPRIGKGTVYRNLGVLAEEGSIRKVEIPNGPDRFDFTLEDHYHMKCMECGEIFDVDMEKLPDLREKIRDTHGMEFLDYDILFRGLCPACAAKRKEERGWIKKQCIN